jgi:PAS domain S-box-containing protein
VSEEYARMSGCRPEDMVGKSIVEIMGEENFKLIWPHVKAALAGQRAEYEAYAHFKAVGRRLLHVIDTPDKDRFGQVHGWIASITDITEKREAEVRLAADLEAMSLLREVGEQCLNPRISFDDCLYKILDAAIAVTGADKGNLQIRDSITGALRIVAHRGFNSSF